MVFFVGRFWIYEKLHPPIRQQDFGRKMQKFTAKKPPPPPVPSYARCAWNPRAWVRHGGVLPRESRQALEVSGFQRVSFTCNHGKWNERPEADDLHPKKKWKIMWSKPSQLWVPMWEIIIFPPWLSWHVPWKKSTEHHETQLAFSSWSPSVEVFTGLGRPEVITWSPTTKRKVATLSSGWLNHPIEKYESKLDHFPKDQGATKQNTT